MRAETGGRTDLETTEGADTSGRSWRVVGVGHVQVDGTLSWERRWGEGVTERCGNKTFLLMGGR